jgi:hypothetical protein
MVSVSTDYISVGGNRHPGAADWDVQSGVLAYGADNNVALWEPVVGSLGPHHRGSGIEADILQGNLLSGRVCPTRGPFRQSQHNQILHLPLHRNEIPPYRLGRSNNSSMAAGLQ